MNEHDRKYLEDIGKQLGQMPDTFDVVVVVKLRDIIKRLDKEVTELKEAGQPFAKGITPNAKYSPDTEFVIRTPFRNISRLAQALREVKDE